MPKVKTFKTYFGGEEFQAVFHVDGKGLFTARIPDSAAQVLNFNEVQGNTLDACEKAFEKAKKDLGSACTTTERVILYDVKATAHIMDAAGERCMFFEKEISFTHGTALSVAAQVFDEKCITYPDGEKQYRYDAVKGAALSRSSVSSGADFRLWRDQKEAHRMVYSPEREAFFLKIARAMDSVILQLQKLKFAEEAVKIADSGVLQLGEGT
jgi:hypothetical protein